MLLEAGLSPGKQATKYGQVIDKKRKLHRIMSASKEGKRTRIQRKKLKDSIFNFPSLYSFLKCCPNLSFDTHIGIVIHDICQMTCLSFISKMAYLT